MGWGCSGAVRCWRLNGFLPSAMALVMPKRFVAEFGLVPLRVAGGSLLYLAFENRTNPAAALGVEQMTGLKVESGLLSWDAVCAGAEGVAGGFGGSGDDGGGSGRG